MSLICEEMPGSCSQASAKYLDVLEGSAILPEKGIAKVLKVSVSELKRASYSCTGKGQTTLPHSRTSTLRALPVPPSSSLSRDQAFNHSLSRFQISFWFLQWKQRSTYSKSRVWQSTQVQKTETKDCCVRGWGQEFLCMLAWCWSG